MSEHQVVTVILAAVSRWPEEWRVEFDERAAIREYDGGMPRREAERVAFVDVLRRKKQSDDTK